MRIERLCPRCGLPPEQCKAVVETEQTLIRLKSVNWHMCHCCLRDGWCVERAPGYTCVACVDRPEFA